MHAQVDIVDDRRFLLKISTPRGTTLFQAPSADILSQLHLRLTSKINEYKAMPTAARKAMRQASLANPFEVDVQYFASMNEPVKEGFQDDADDHDGEASLLAEIVSFKHTIVFLFARVLSTYCRSPLPYITF